MTAQFLRLPDLPTWTRQLAGILPFSALIEFIDVDMKLHLYELTGRIPLWNWPLTPAGARLLLSSEDTEYACCLDRPSRSVTLHCIDGKYGDMYPCSTPTTVRLCLSAECDVFPVRNESSNLTAMTTRRQKLTVVHVAQRKADLAHATTSFTFHNLRYWLFWATGWLFWAALIVVTSMAGCYYGLIHLICIPTTGVVVRATHGFKGRQVICPEYSSSDRLVIVSDSMNASEWWAFYGKSGLINAMLNKPLYRKTKASASRILRWVTQLLIASQWILAIGSCALQDWNALFISLWLALCGLVSIYGYPPEDNVRDWLRHDCNLLMYQYPVTLSTRRAMLSALVYLNPDSKERCMKWIDPILTDAQDRREWEAAILLHMNDESSVEEIVKSKYWWKFILEGVEVGRKIKASINSQTPSTAG